MLVFEWGNLLRGTSSHPMSDVRQVAKLLGELPLDNPGKAAAEAAAWLESIELESGFSAAHRLQVVAMIDDAAHASLARVMLDYAVRPDTVAAGLDRWRILSEFYEKLA